MAAASVVLFLAGTAFGGISVLVGRLAASRGAAAGLTLGTVPAASATHRVFGVALFRINLTAFYRVRRTAHGWLADWIFFRATKFITLGVEIRS